MIVGPSIVALSFVALAVTDAGGSYWAGVFRPRGRALDRHGHNRLAPDDDGDERRR
ncbi:MAG: hypothetical protein WDM84_04705 [Bauldia sp.]